jgi:hypothetical protein
MRPDKEGFLKLTETGVKENSLCRPGTYGRRRSRANVSVAAWKTKPSWYLVATADRAIQPAFQPTMAKAIKARTVEVTMLARPDESTKLILATA